MERPSRSPARKIGSIAILGGGVLISAFLGARMALQGSSPVSSESPADRGVALVESSHHLSESSILSTGSGGVPAGAPAAPLSDARLPSAAAGKTVTAVASAEAVSRECKSLWGSLTSAGLEGWRVDALSLRGLQPAAGCASNDKKLSALQAAYEKACASPLEGRSLDDSVPEERRVVEACVQAAKAIRSYLGYKMAAGQALAEITDPNVLMDKLLVATGVYDGTAIGKGPLKLDPASYADVSATALRLLQVADTNQEKNLASRFYVAAEAESAGLMPRDVFRGVATASPSAGSVASTDSTQASPGSAPPTTASSANSGGTTLTSTSPSTSPSAGVATSPSAGLASGSDAQSQQIADIRSQVETYNPGFFNHPHRGGNGAPDAPAPTSSATASQTAGATTPSASQ